MGIPPERDWLAYCLDEALHILDAGHHARDRRWEDAFKRDRDDDTLIDRLRAEPGRGRPPKMADIAALEAAGAVER